MINLAVMGYTEWILIIVVLLLLFGARKLPELARSMGSSVKEFKKGMDTEAKDEKPLQETRPPPSINGSSKDR